MSTQLASDEKVLWRGEPSKGIRFVWADLFIVPFSLLWTFGIVAGFFGATTNNDAKVEPELFFILPFFVFIGFYLLIGRFIVDAWARARTKYLLTNRRAVIESNGWPSSVRSVSLGALPEIRFRQHGSERATIEFGSGNPMFGSFPRGWPGASRFQPPAFDNINEGRRVYDMILSAQRDLQR
jgi:hypothetical protein